MRYIPIISSRATAILLQLSHAEPFRFIPIISWRICTIYSHYLMQNLYDLLPFLRQNHFDLFPLSHSEPIRLTLLISHGIIYSHYLTYHHYDSVPLSHKYILQTDRNADIFPHLTALFTHLIESLLDPLNMKILYEEYKLQISLSHVCFTLLLLRLSWDQISSRATSTYGHASKLETAFHTQ
jgi:hypothetical protein